MSIRDRFPSAKLPRSHYFLTISRGEKVRALAVRPSLAMAAMAAIPVLAIWAGGATAFIAFHDQVVTALLSREAQTQTDYETRLSSARAELDRVASRQMLDQNAVETKMRVLLSRQAKLEQRGEALAALAADADVPKVAEARPKALSRTASALTAIQAIGGGTDGDLGAASAYAPAPARAAPPKPRPLDGGIETLGRAATPDPLAASLTAAAADATLDANARVGLVDYSLDRVERAQVAAIAGVVKNARASARRMESVIARTGLDPAALKAPDAHAAGGMGGPYVPLDPANDAFDRAVSDAARDIEATRRLRRLMPHLPLQYPLAGEANVSSPFGYRPDPFLGRPALHPGVDLVQAFGSDIKATAIGRVTHAGPMGGYGNAVEIDHGNGIATRFGHMSQVLVEEGQTVKAGDVIGRIGSTGRSTGPHLHYEVRVDGEAVDPERFLTANRE